MRARDLWTIVRANGQPVLPFDCNPRCADEGMLVYRSERAARMAAAHQRRLYGIQCKPARLSALKG